MNKKYLILFLLAGLSSNVYGQASNPSVGPLSKGESGTFSTGTEDTLQDQDEFGRRTTQEGKGFESRRMTRDIYGEERGPADEYSQRGEMRRMHKPMAQKDRALIQDIRAQITADESLSDRAKSVSIDSRNGNIILRGSVANNQEKARLEEIVKKTQGAVSIENQTEVKRY